MGDADTNNNTNNDDSNSTVSNLPVLFANGYPTSLEKMSRSQLELFIPFLLKCSLNLRYIDEKHAAPKWWPTNLEYKIPFGKPKNLKKVSFSFKLIIGLGNIFIFIFQSRTGRRK